MLVTFHPQLAFVQAYANNDVTAAALSAVVFLLAVRAVRRGIAFAPCIAIGVLTGWLILSKYSALAVMPAIALLLLAAAYLHKQRPQKVLLAFAISAGVAVALSSWWFIRNAHEFSGDIFGVKSLYQTRSNFHPMQKPTWVQHRTWMQIISQRRFWRFLYFSYWGLFGYMTKYMWRPIYLQYTAILICGLLGLVPRHACRLEATTVTSETIGETGFGHLVFAWTGSRL
jgi:4-amino-4-deoxy-L-arabinose transferase-like glycosyltransferase